VLTDDKIFQVTRNCSQQVILEAVAMVGGDWQQIYELFKSALITTVTKVNRLEWLGHIERMDDSRQTRNVHTHKSPRSRPWLEQRCGLEKELQQVKTLVLKVPESHFFAAMLFNAILVLLDLLNLLYKFERNKGHSSSYIGIPKMEIVFITLRVDFSQHVFCDLDTRH
jgi:hypothetical protein